MQGEMTTVATQRRRYHHIRERRESDVSRSFETGARLRFGGGCFFGFISFCDELLVSFLPSLPV